MLGDCEVERVVAVDWSGRVDEPGQRRHIWGAVWTASGGGGVYGGRVELENKRTQIELVNWLIEMKSDTPRMVVGVDFCFSYPEWFVKERGARTAAEFWEIVRRDGEHWLSRECQDARFWGRPGKHRDGKKPQEFRAEHALRMFRRADLACKVRGKILLSADEEKVKGIAPKSPFQIGGAGAVGTGTLRGIPFLPQLQAEGYSIWPFDLPRFPLLVEIYPRLLTGKVAKSGKKGRCDYLAEKQRKNANYACLSEDVMTNACGSEDAFDALVSVMEMAARRDDFTRFPQAADAVTLLEGAVWGAGV